MMSGQVMYLPYFTLYFVQVKILHRNGVPHMVRHWVQHGTTMDMMVGGTWYNGTIKIVWQ